MQIPFELRARQSRLLKLSIPLTAIAVFFSLLAAAGWADRITAADAARKQNSGWQHDASATAPIAVKQWATPKPGWLYVLDPQPVPRSLSGRVWLVDPEAGKVMGVIVTGSNPDFALSPDGTLLYVTSKGIGDQSNLAIIDTGDGAVLRVGAVENRAVSTGMPPFSSMAVSGDGLVLRILVTVPNAPEIVGFQLASYDARTGSFCPDTCSWETVDTAASLIFPPRIVSIFYVQRPIVYGTSAWMRRRACSTTPSWCFHGNGDSASQKLFWLLAIET